ncbi:MAG: hypothetical protein SGI72_02290 [Planctomycetota bacterium]|nr:hypothetical protein [Planctomycetota bacterium]
MIVKACVLFVLSSSALLRPAFATRVENVPNTCELSARALLLADRSAVDERYLRAIAIGFADATRSWHEMVLTILSDRRAAFALADLRFQARLETCVLFGGAPYAPRITPIEFTPIVDHPLYPLVPGRTLVYELHGADRIERKDVTTLRTTVAIQGVTCRPVETVCTVNGEVTETSTNWYAQHADGSVWWFGELNQHFVDGILASLEGSWRAGLNGAQAGIVVPSFANLEAPFRRGLSIGCIEGVARVTSRTSTIEVPFGRFDNAVEIEELDPLEPLELILEILVRGIGLVAEVEPSAGARLELVAIFDAPQIAPPVSGARSR